MMIGPLPPLDVNFTCIHAGVERAIVIGNLQFGIERARGRIERGSGAGDQAGENRGSDIR